MKRKITKFSSILIIMALLMMINSMVFSQNDTVIVPSGSDLFQVIGDELDGSGMLTNHVFVLAQDGAYFISDVINVNDNITLYGEEGDGVPPFILPRKSGNDQYVDNWFHCEGQGQEFTTKNIIFQFLTNDGMTTGIGIPKLMDILGENARIVLNNCVFNGFQANMIGSYGNGQYIKITNCKFRNSRFPSNDWRGSILEGSSGQTGGGWKDSLIFRNNSMINMGNTALTTFYGEICKVAIVDHNTFFGSTRGAVFFGFQANVEITNNMFVAWESSGAPKRRYNQEWLDTIPIYDTLIINKTGYKYGAVFDIFPIGIDALGPMHDILGIDTTGGTKAADKGRRFVLKNNCNWWPKQLVEAWDTIDEDGGAEVPYVFMQAKDTFFIKNEPQSVLENFYGHKFSEEARTSDFDPGFDKDLVDHLMNTMIVWLDGFRNEEDWTPYIPNIDPAGHEYQLQWPLPENLAYTNETLKTAGTDGLPLGDLNWFKDTGTGKKLLKVSKNNKLSNYPNPFQDITNILYSVGKSSNIKISVYDLTGKEINILVNKFLSKGEYNVQWNGTNLSGQKVPEGIYFCRLQNNSETTVITLVKVK